MFIVNLSCICCLQLVCKCDPKHQECLGWINYGSDGEVNKNISIHIKKVLAPPGTTPYDRNGAKDQCVNE